MSMLSAKPVKRLKLRRISRREMGRHKSDMIDMMAPTADPYSAMLYEVPIDGCRQRAKDISAGVGRHITLTPVIIQMIGHAIAENPVFNQQLFDGRLYEFQEIAIANLVLVPGTDAIAYVVVENPHRKSLADIQQELFAGIARLRETAAAAPGPVTAFCMHLVYKYGLYRLIGQRRAFAFCYERGMGSNISLSVHTYDTASSFIMVKDVISPVPYYPKIHVCGPVKKPVFDDGMLVGKDMLQIHVTTDHRIVNGAHAHEFGKSLARIAASPERYLQ